jgi:hypothetical protein
VNAAGVLPVLQVRLLRAPGQEEFLPAPALGPHVDVEAALPFALEDREGAA